MRDYRGDFEVHVTVRVAGEAALCAFREWCGQRAFKCVRIVLARGEHPEQPMAAWRRRGTTLPAVIEEAQRDADEAQRAGFVVVRVKVEAAPHNAEVPRHDADAVGHDGRNYFEHHLKLQRDATAPCDALLQTCQRHGAHLSRNAFRQPTQGQEERFVTLRSYGVGSLSSCQQRERLLAALAALGERVIEHESEYCVYDSNLDLDAGWLPATS